MRINKKHIYTPYGFVLKFIGENGKLPDSLDFEQAGYCRSYYYELMKKYEKDFDEALEFWKNNQKRTID